MADLLDLARTIFELVDDFDARNANPIFRRDVSGVPSTSQSSQPAQRTAEGQPESEAAASEWDVISVAASDGRGAWGASDGQNLQS